MLRGESWSVMIVSSSPPSLLTWLIMMRTTQPPPGRGRTLFTLLSLIMCRSVHKLKVWAEFLPHKECGRGHTSTPHTSLVYEFRDVLRVLSELTRYLSPIKDEKYLIENERAPSLRPMGSLSTESVLKGVRLEPTVQVEVFSWLLVPARLWWLLAKCCPTLIIYLPHVGS